VTWKDGWEGSWSVVAWSDNGHPAPGDYCRAIQVTFRGQRVRFALFGKSRQGSFQVNSIGSPAELDLWLDRREEPRRAIYRLERNRLTLCLSSNRLAKRPTRFDSKRGADNIFIVLRRGEVRLDAAEDSKALAWARMDQQKEQSRNNLRQLANALIDHADAHKGLLSPAITDKQGKPLLSWRVAVLPYLEEEALYRQFKLDEPWDNPHNKKLLPRMPKVYAPVRGNTKETHSTYYQTFVGPGALFEPGKQLRFPVGISDGTSNTILLAEAREAVPWTKPVDLPYDPRRPLPKLGGHFPDGFLVGMADGWVQWVHRGFNERDLRAAITPAGGEILQDIFMPPRGLLDGL
jgi:uncharacterized protein (TIGR03067 family)